MTTLILWLILFPTAWFGYRIGYSSGLRDGKRLMGKAPE